MKQVSSVESRRCRQRSSSVERSGAKKRLVSADQPTETQRNRSSIETEKLKWPFPISTAMDTTLLALLAITT